MATKIAAVIGWLGTALVVVALGLRFLEARTGRLPRATRLGRAGHASSSISSPSGASRPAGPQRPADQARRACRWSASSRCWRILVGLNYLGVRQNKRWDLTANQVFSLSEQTLKVLQGLDRAGEDHRLRSGGAASIASAIGSRNTPTRASSSRSSTSTSTASRRGPRRPTCRPPARWCSSTRAASSASRRSKNRTSPTPSSRRRPARSARSTSPQGHGEKDPTSSERTGYNAVAAGADRRQLRLREAGAGADPGGARRRHGGHRRRPAHRLLPAGDRRAQDLPRQGRQAPGDARPGREDRARRRCPTCRRCVNEWGIEVGDDVVVDASGVGQMFGGDASVPVAASYPAHPITERFNLMTAYPAGAVGHGAGRRRRRPHAAGVRRDQRAELGREGPRRPASAASRCRSTPQAGDRPGPIALGAAVSAPATDAPQPAGPGRGPGRAADAGDARRRDRRFRLRRQLRPRHPGQPRPVHEHRELAGAAGRPDRGPAARARGSAADDDRRSAEPRRRCSRSSSSRR